ncbi:MAG: cytochrome C oxidase subunit III [Verrucomicrobiaceae bacterium]|nr:MAG: cytochrome C oxidase subunit III [Verrucomicrobiaceae bacterium]
MSPADPSQADPPSGQPEKDRWPVLRDHVYDGIQEFDQPLPNWWLWTLYLAILWALTVWFWEFQIARPLNLAKPDGQRVSEAVTEVKDRQAAHLTQVLSTLDDRRFWEMARNPEVTARGRATYENICAACHAKDLSAMMGGAKLPGLPLNDAEWKYGGKPLDIFRTVTKGSPDPTKGMIAWEPQLGGVKVAEIVAYILSTHQPEADLTAK